MEPDGSLVTHADLSGLDRGFNEFTNVTCELVPASG